MPHGTLPIVQTPSLPPICWLAGWLRGRLPALAHPRRGKFWQLAQLRLLTCLALIAPQLLQSKAAEIEKLLARLSDINDSMRRWGGAPGSREV